MKIANDITELTGNTPLVRLNRLVESSQAEIAVKLEYFNPSHRLKDRIGVVMINAAEKSGQIHKDTIILEATSGNTGIGLAFTCAARGYECTIIMPDKVSKERIILLKAYGTNVIFTPGKEGMRGAIDLVNAMASKNKRFFVPRQFENPANPEIHRQTTALEV